MNAAPCTAAALAYNAQRGVRNHNSGPRTRQTCGFFVPADFGGREGREYPNSARRSVAVLNSRPPFTGQPVYLRNQQEATMASNTRIAPPWHPLFQGFDAPSIEDSLNNCAATLHLLSDLFGGNDDQYPILDSSESRRGLWIQLVGIATTLEAISAHLGGKRASVQAKEGAE